MKKLQLCIIVSCLLHHAQSNTIEIQNEIKQITFDTSLLAPDGATFTEQSLPKFLAQAYQEKKLTDDNFSKESCLKAEKIDTKGSFNTVQLFRVTSTCRAGKTSIYIVKEAKDGIKETQSLQAVAQHPGVKELMAPSTPPKGLPSLALPIVYFSYAGTSGYGLHYITVMPAAQGKSLCQIVIEYRNNPSPQNAEKIKRAYKILGTELANFHKRFKSAHRDMHCVNVFYDEITGHFTFIDLETMDESLKKLYAPDDDILKLFLGLFSTSEAAERRDIIKGIDLKVWHNLAFKSFIEGYLDTYTPASQKQKLQDLKNMFNGNKKFSWLHIAPAELQKIRTNYINPVFDEIEKQRFTKK